MEKLKASESRLSALPYRELHARLRVLYTPLLVQNRHDLVQTLYKETCNQVGEVLARVEKLKASERPTKPGAACTFTCIVHALPGTERTRPGTKLIKDSCNQVGEVLTRVAVSYTHLTLPTICSV